MPYIYNNKITQNATVLYTINSMFKKIQYKKSLIKSLIKVLYMYA